MRIGTISAQLGAGRGSACLFILAALAIATPAAAENNGSWCACGVQSRVPATFEIDHRPNWQRAARAEFGRWNLYADLFRVRTGDGRAGRNRKNEIVFFNPEQTSRLYGLVIDVDTFGVTFLSPREAFGNPSFNACPPPTGTTCGRFQETDVIMNSRFGRGWTTAAPNYQDTGPALYGATALHELGHAIGLHHLFDAPSTMNYYHDFAARYLTRSDAQAVRGHYPDRARQRIDVATYPFRFSGFQYSGVSIASVSPGVLQRGETFVLSDFTVENVGSQTVSDFRFSVYFSSDRKITTGDHLIGVLTWDTFPTWWETAGWTFRVPADLPPGTYYVGALVTYGGGRQDRVTYNNRWVLDDARTVTVR